VNLALGPLADTGITVAWTIHVVAQRHKVISSFAYGVIEGVDGKFRAERFVSLDSMVMVLWLRIILLHQENPRGKRQPKAEKQPQHCRRFTANIHETRF